MLHIFILVKTMNNKLENIFNKNYRRLRRIKNLEFALRGGEYHFIEIKNNIIINSSTKKDYYLSVRGEYKKNYFSFNSIFKDDLFDMIILNQNIKNHNLIKYPFLKPVNYRDNNALEINFDEYNNLLLLDLISKYIFEFLAKKYTINGKIYIKNGRISPFSNAYPIISIVNSKGINAQHKQNKIVINLELRKDNNTIIVNKTFNNIKEIKNYLEQKNNDIQEKLNLKTLKNYTINNNKIVFSSLAIAKILHKIKNNFSSTDYFENEFNIFRKHLNKRIFSHKINIQSTPYHPLLPIAPFDEIGEEKTIVNIIKNGKLRELTASYYESIKYKIALTGDSFLDTKNSRIMSLYLKGSNTNLESILKNNTNIIYIDDLNIVENIRSLNQKIKINAKNTSYIYKKGKLNKKIENLDLNISLQELFMSVVELTEEKEELAMITPEILVSLS